MNDRVGQVVDQFDWSVDFQGLLHVLAKALYTESDVFIRELIQNAYDAITVRITYQAGIWAPLGPFKLVKADLKAIRLAEKDRQ